ncbi:MAG TPA: alpha/beta hydrolase [Alphaproteobacteria bacterium]|nr:alpha/beta hydrolase [Alphaproteobacteria bacterium]
MNAYEGGDGRALLMVHGSGPGASSIGNWQLVLDDLAARYHVLAIDLIGFGLSDRKPEPPYFDFDLWIRQIGTALDYLGATDIGLVGHSLAGALVLKAASLDSRVSGVLTTGTMGALMPVNPALNYVWRCPTSREEMRRAAQALIADHSLITDAYLDFRMQVVGSKEYQRYFNEMFDQPFETYIAAAVLDDETLARISAPVLMLHGTEDDPIPAETGSIALQPKLPKADVLLLHNCSHSVAMERRAAFLNAVFGHFEGRA